MEKDSDSEFLIIDFVNSTRRNYTKSLVRGFHDRIDD